MYLETKIFTILSDLMTPVGLYLKIRSSFPEVVLLESSDYSSKEDSKSFICFDPLLTLQKDADQLTLTDRIHHTIENVSHKNDVEAVSHFLSLFQLSSDVVNADYLGIFGYTAFDMVEAFENIEFNKAKSIDGIPVMRYDLFRFTLVFDHYFEKLFLVENLLEGETSKMGDLLNIIQRQHHQSFDFDLEGPEYGNMSDEQYLELVQKAKDHCQRGDVFQMVLSRRFSQGFKGDEFNVYRTLRSVNPSPYLFYFDYGGYKIFGSSPEAQLIVSKGIAEIHPIAGTFKRSGHYSEDQRLAQQLFDDPKENAEHIMLVDLARNDLSKHCDQVEVAKYKEVQFFSHVIHLVSKVTGKMKANVSSYQIFADTFPAGTLSGAPKNKALHLIDQYEPSARCFYGGGLGFIKLNGDLNHAIIIRSFLSKSGRLQYQAGAGIVMDSEAQNELQEVNNKLAALKKAMTQAQYMHSF